MLNSLNNHEFVYNCIYIWQKVQIVIAPWLPDPVLTQIDDTKSLGHNGLISPRLIFGGQIPIQMLYLNSVPFVSVGALAPNDAGPSADTMLTSKLGMVSLKFLQVIFNMFYTVPIT